MKDKLIYLFLPFCLTLVGLTVGYTFLHWLLLIELDLFQLNEMMIDLVIPFVLAALATWFLLRPRIQLIKYDPKRENQREAIGGIMLIALVAPLMISQHYIVSASGKLSVLNSVNEINQTPKSKYYTLKKYYIDKTSIGIHPAFDASGRNNEHLNMHIYAALPIFEKASDTSTTEPAAWLGIEYREQISNRLEQQEKEEKYRAFARQSQNDFDKKNVSEFVYLDRLFPSEKREGFIEAIKVNERYRPNDIVLEAINEPFEARNGDKLAWIFGSSLIGSGILLLLLFVPKLDEERLNRMKEGVPDDNAHEETDSLLELLKPRDGYVITPIVIGANLGIFLIMVAMGLGFLSFKGQDLLQWGANYGPLTIDGEWWRLFTSTFVHGGVMHVFANMYGLLIIGSMLEPLLGRAVYATAYVLTGIIASVASIVWYEATVSVGASGAIFGLEGIFLALLLTKIFPPEIAKTLLTSSAVFIGYNLLMGLSGGIDNAAHIGGLLSGFVVGLVLYPSIKQRIEEEASA